MNLDTSYLLKDIQKRVMSDLSCVFGVDYDGTIANTNLIKARWIWEQLQIEVGPWQCDRTSCVPLIGEQNYKRMCDAVYERELSERAPPVQGALDALKALSKQGKVYIVTARVPHRLTFAREWLVQHRVADCVSDCLSSFGTDKQTICGSHGVGVLIDDDERHLTRIASGRVKRILLKPGLVGHLGVPDSVTLCRSWDEVLSSV